MSKKSKTWFSTVSAGGNDTLSLSSVPTGEVWVVTEFGAADINKGDHLSSIYTLKWDGAFVDGAIIVVTGCSFVLKGNWEFAGDNSKQLTVDRFNTSGSAKQMPVWLIGYKRS